MKHKADKELFLILRRGWDPRRGSGKWVGWLNWLGWTLLAIVFFMSTCLGPSVIAPIGPLYDALFLISCIILISCWISVKGIESRTKKRARDADWFLCPWCRYDLTACEDEGICPECGCKYDREVCRALYINLYRDYHPEKQIKLKLEREAWKRALELKHNVVFQSSSR